MRSLLPGTGPQVRGLRGPITSGEPDTPRRRRAGAQNPSADRSAACRSSIGGRRCCPGQLVDISTAAFRRWRQCRCWRQRWGEPDRKDYGFGSRDIAQVHVVEHGIAAPRTWGSGRVSQARQPTNVGSAPRSRLGREGCLWAHRPDCRGTSRCRRTTSRSVRNHPRSIPPARAHPGLRRRVCPIRRRAPDRGRSCHCSPAPADRAPPGGADQCYLRGHPCGRLAPRHLGDRP